MNGSGQVHMCNKLASRHVRVGLANPSDVPRCDICENAPGISDICLLLLFIFSIYIICLYEIVPLVHDRR